MFNPFSFDVDFTAGVDVKYDGATLAGIELDAELTGPTPFHVHGTASLQFLFFSVGVTVDITWGDDNAVTLPAVAVLPQLNTALTTPGSWSAQLPDGAQQAVTLRGLPPAETDVVVHPMGSLTVRENVVPLDVPVTKFGNTTPADGTQFAIASVTLGTSPAATSPVPGNFAPGQFQQLSDADKISAPAFEEFHCGVAIGDPSVRAGSDAPRTVTTQWRYVPDPTKASVLDRFAVLDADVLGARVQTGAGARSLVKNTGLERYTEPGLTSIVSVSEVGYVITSTEDLLGPRRHQPGRRTTRYQASAALAGRTWRPIPTRPAACRSSRRTRRRHERAEGRASRRPGASGRHRMTASQALTPRADPPGARFHFRPWLRRGIAGDIATHDGPGLPRRARRRR